MFFPTSTLRIQADCFVYQLLSCLSFQGCNCKYWYWYQGHDVFLRLILFVPWPLHGFRSGWIRTKVADATARPFAILLIHPSCSTGIVDLNSLNPDLDPAFQVNTDPGFWWPKIEKTYSRKFVFCSIFVGQFCPPGSGSNPDPDPDPQHCLLVGLKLRLRILTVSRYALCGSGSWPGCLS